MFNLAESFKLLTLARDEGGRSPSRAGARRPVNLETLEGRALLSHVVATHHVKPAVDVAQVSSDHLPRHPHPGPIVDLVGEGHAVKSPRFYEFYTGPKNANLNAAGMKATYDAAGNLVLTGILAGSANSAPTSDAASQYYVFGIDRGLTSGKGPFPGRPNIRFDTLVSVGFTPNGVAGTVKDLTTGQTTAIDPSGIVNQSSGQDIKIYVPAGTPGVTYTAGGPRYKAVFWAQTTPPSDTPNPADIASFAPDGRDVLIAGAPGMAPAHHLL